MGTEDEATADTPQDRLRAYVESARKTVAGFTSHEENRKQLFNEPGYFLFRTIPKGTGKGGRQQNMRAIMAIDRAGFVKVATYFVAT